MKQKFYFRNLDDEMCYTLEHYLSIAREEGLKEIELFEAVPAKSKMFFWCEKLETSKYKGECGKLCEDYQPRNGKNGICKHHNNLQAPGKRIKFSVPEI